ncbi:MAG TPA: NAD-dependent epimerase/dehydratase family protein [Dehalococcoidia bacterium]
MTNAQERVLVSGAGGFIGWHLVRYLKAKGYFVRGADIKEPEFGASDADEFFLIDLRNAESCEKVCEGIDEIYHLAADMGGMGFISSHHAEILHNNGLIDINMIEAARKASVSRYLYSSSACVYPVDLQVSTAVTPLKESDAFPANPEDGYGWEKLYGELLCQYYATTYGMITKVVRFHNIFGPYGTWDGGREKAPAAISRKVALAKLQGQAEIEIWGDGEQTRSFCYVGDCVEGLHKLMRSDVAGPLNLGQDRMISINDLVRLVGEIAGFAPEVRHVDGPQGVRGRNSDNTLLRVSLGWEPSVSLEEGMRKTYEWIEPQVREQVERAAGVTGSAGR